MIEDIAPESPLMIHRASAARAGGSGLDEPEEVALYVRFLDLLRDTAATGRDAVTLIRRVMAELRD